MNLDDLKTLPQYIEAPGGGMWLWTGEAANQPALYLRFADVVKLLEESCQKNQD